ncbi:MAG TPA: hypothetical protein EYO73_05695 [Sulfurimonas sp.]|nr:hypothetical protein [Sulfurimonas sp.]
MARMMSLPFKYSFAPSRWKQSIHLMMEKKKGFPHVSKLCMIQLFEADFNAVLKLKIGRHLMQHKVVQHNLGHEMHGGWQHRSTHHALLMQQLSCNIAQQQRSKISVLNLDASKCFDRIFPHLAIPTMSRLGAPRSLCIALAKILRNMTHKVRTAQGLSPTSIQPMLSEIWSGIGQGGGASSPICLSVLLPIIFCMSKYSRGVQFSDPFHMAW